MNIQVKDRTYGNGNVIVYKGGDLNLRYYTRKGRFDLMSNEDSFSCHIAVYENGVRLAHCNITPEYEVDGDDIEEAISEINDYIRRTWYSSDMWEIRRLRNFLERYQDKIEYGNAKKELEVTNKEIDRLVARRLSLNQTLGYFQETL